MLTLLTTRFFNFNGINIRIKRLLATQSIEARARREGRAACTIGLSINEDPKLEKGKETKGSAARRYIQSYSHVIATI